MIGSDLIEENLTKLLYKSNELTVCVKKRFARNARHDYAQREARTQRKESQRGRMERQWYAQFPLPLSSFLPIFQHTIYHVVRLEQYICR